jgi:hypothetical protein
LHRADGMANGTRPATGPGDVVLHGLAAGFVGYAIVGVFFLVADPVAGRPLFHTPALLGSALFYGLSDPAALRIGPGPVLAYNGLHFLVFLLLGFGAAWFVRMAERLPMGWVLALNLTTLVLFHVFGAFVFFTEPMRAAIPLGAAVAATVLAVAAMTAYIFQVHPQLRGELAADEPPD